MKLFVCVSEDMGMAFHDRRQSRDERVVEDIIRTIAGEPLSCDSYTAVLFANHPDVVLNECCEPLACAGWVFVEREDPVQAADSISEIVIYRWNRSYPSSIRFGLDLDAFVLADRAEFAGNSHEKITRDHYVQNV